MRFYFTDQQHFWQVGVAALGGGHDAIAASLSFGVDGARLRAGGAADRVDLRRAASGLVIGGEPQIGLREFWASWLLALGRVALPGRPEGLDHSLPRAAGG